MKVSVIVPNYNYARYLDARIGSILRQTFTDLEVVIVDDASTDGSGQVIARYLGDPRVRAIWYGSNSGRVYERWNDGAATARGEYLLFAGADDDCEPTLVERLVRVLDARPEVGIAFSRSWVVDPEGQRLGVKPGAARWSSDFVATGAEEAPFLLTDVTIPTASAALLRRSVFERCGGFDLSFRLAADYMLWARMLSLSSLAYVCEPLNAYRHHPRSASARLVTEWVLPESYRVMAFILETFDVPVAARERALDRIASRWVKQWLAEPRARRLRTCGRTYRAARRVDPSIHGRLARAAWSAGHSVLARRRH